jgi:glycerate kinase
MATWGERLARAAGRAVAGVPGAGAAGGLGAALLALGATLVPGGRAVAEMVGLAEAVRHADVVVTSEGRVDAQSAAGKVVGTVVAEARAQGRPVVVAAPGFSDETVFLESGVVLWSVLPRPMTLDEARASARALAVNAGRRLYYGVQGWQVSPPVSGH